MKVVHFGKTDVPPADRGGVNLHGNTLLPRGVRYRWFRSSRHLLTGSGRGLEDTPPIEITTGSLPGAKPEGIVIATPYCSK